MCIHICLNVHMCMLFFLKHLKVNCIYLLLTPIYFLRIRSLSNITVIFKTNLSKYNFEIIFLFAPLFVLLFGRTMHLTAS